MAATAGGRTAILIVNGFDRESRWGRLDPAEATTHPWIDLCLSQVERHSAGSDYTIFVFDNSHLEAHRSIARRRARVRLLPTDDDLARARSATDTGARLAGLVKSHPVALDALVAEVGSDHEYIITLDTDAFPIRDGWIEALRARIDAGAWITGVYRDEMVPRLRPFIHVSCLCIRRDTLLGLEASFVRGFAQDVGQNLTDEVLRRGGTISPLRRSNARNAHFLMAGIYGDLVYHHGAGSRRAVFWTSTDVERDERLRITLRDAAFRDIDRLVAGLRGEADDDLGIGWVT